MLRRKNQREFTIPDRLDRFVSRACLIESPSSEVDAGCVFVFDITADVLFSILLFVLSLFVVTVEAVAVVVCEVFGLVKATNLSLLATIADGGGVTVEDFD